VKAAVKGAEMEHELLFKDGLCIIVRGAQSKQPIVIRREHELHTLPMFKQALKQTAKRMFPDHEIDEPEQEAGDHYYFFMKPKQEKEK